MATLCLPVSLRCFLPAADLMALIHAAFSSSLPHEICVGASPFTISTKPCGSVPRGRTIAPPSEAATADNAAPTARERKHTVESKEGGHHSAGATYKKSRRTPQCPATIPPSLRARTAEKAMVRRRAKPGGSPRAADVALLSPSRSLMASSPLPPSKLR